MSEMNEILHKLSTYPEVEAIAIGGSRATNRYDAASDYDVYIYLVGELSIESRKAILAPECRRLELGNHYWELEDNGTLHSGIDFDLVYRNLSDFENDIRDVVIHAHPRNSYTTCFWNNLLTCRIIHERNHALSRLKERYQLPYPEELRQAILRNNLNLLHGCIPSYDMQIKKALQRGDLVSVNHRVTEFLATYFDLLFALNRVLHPGEKRMVQIAKETCTMLPYRFEENLQRLFQTMYTEDMMQVLNDMINAVFDLCEKENHDKEKNTDGR